MFVVSNLKLISTFLLTSKIIIQSPAAHLRLDVLQDLVQHIHSQTHSPLLRLLCW